MINLVLATQIKGAYTFCAAMALPAIALVLVIIYGIYTYFSIKSKYKKAKKSQRLMFNELKTGDYVWRLVGETIYPYKVNKINYIFNKDNICKEISLHLVSPSNSYDVLHINIKIEDSQTFKHDNFYTLYNEAHILQKVIKKKRGEQINAISKVSNDKLASEVNEVIKRLEKIKEEYK